MTPTISTARLTLRQLIKATPRNMVWLRDPEVVRYSEQRHDNHTLSTQLRYIGSFGGRSHLWGIYVVTSGLHIGNVSARVDEPNNIAELGIMIGEKEHWRLGYAGEAWRAACTWLLDLSGGAVRKIEAGCMRENIPMMKIMQASGFVQEGERLNHFLLEGRPVGMVMFGRMK